MPLKEFEKKQLDWWCNYYQNQLKTLRGGHDNTLNGEIKVG